MFKKFQMLGKAIKAVKPNVPKTKIQKAIRDLKIATQKNKASKAKLDQTIFEFGRKEKFTFPTKKGKSESNKEKYKRIQGENTKVLKSMIDKATKKKDGGRIGRRFGGDTMPKRKTNVQKIKETFGPKKTLSLKQMKIASLAGNKKKIDGPDFAKLRSKKV